MKKKRNGLLLMLCIMMSSHAFAQDPYVDGSQLPTPSMQGDFDPFSNIANVDLFTGIVSLNIPLCNRNVDGLSLGVSLSYDAKGVPVDQTASSVGLGWDLSAGGYIQREVKGLEDEYTYTIAGVVTPLGLTTSNYKGSLVTNTLDGSYESEHDCFTAVFGGRTIKFAFDGAGNISTSPHCNLKIQMIVDGVSYTQNLPSNIDQTQNDHVLSFVINDEKGNVFNFIRGDYEIKTNPHGVNYYPTDKWVLASITTSTGKTINYTYNSYPLSYKQYSLHSVPCDGMYMPISTSMSGVTLPSPQVVTWNGYVSHIASIQYPDGSRVIFNLSNTTARCDVSTIPFLKSITISNGYDPLTTNSITYQLNQAYFNSIT